MRKIEREAGGAFDITSSHGWNARRRKEGEDEKVRVDF